jgi:hypothetical protein
MGLRLGFIIGIAVAALVGLEGVVSPNPRRSPRTASALTRNQTPNYRPEVMTHSQNHDLGSPASTSSTRPTRPQGPPAATRSSSARVLTLTPVESYPATVRAGPRETPERS